MSRGKRYADEEEKLINIPWKIIGIIVVIIGIIIAGVLGGKKVYSTLISKRENPKIEKSEKDVGLEEKMPAEISNYKVLGEFKIEARNFSQYILDTNNTNVDSTEISYSSKDNNTEENSVQVENIEAQDNAQNKNADITSALKNGLVKLYGNTLNSKGNFCIIGHNQQDYFSILTEMNVNEKFSVTDKTNVEKDYIVTEIYTIEPTDLKCLMPNDKYTEITLITCTTGSNQRLVVKGIEENDYKKYIEEKNNQIGSSENTDNMNNENMNAVSESEHINDTLNPENVQTNSAE